MFPGNFLNLEGPAMNGVVNVVVVHDVLQAVSKFLVFWFSSPRSVESKRM